MQAIVDVILISIDVLVTKVVLLTLTVHTLNTIQTQCNNFYFENTKPYPTPNNLCMGGSELRSRLYPTHMTPQEYTIPDTIATVFRKGSHSMLVTNVREAFLQSLTVLVISEDRLPSEVSLAYLFIALVAAALIYVLHVRRQKNLSRQLNDAQAQLLYLQDKLLKTKDVDSHKEIRIFMEGAFDLMHYGHMNAFRLARSLGTHLVVGVNSDESITECKGAPLMNDQERLAMVSGCKFVDEVIPDCPYVMNRSYLEYVVEKYEIDYIIHGDDPVIVDGKDVYASAKELGMFRTIPRTEGVSTTDIVGRMLLLTKEHHVKNDDPTSPSRSMATEQNKIMESSDEILGQHSKFLTTSRMLQLFSAGAQAPTNNMKVIYIDGAWDLFHPGHVAILKAARERGDYLIVGVHSDAVVNQVRGMNLPLLNLHERVLSVLGCRFVDDVLIDAPWEVTLEMVASLNISEVVCGINNDDIILPHYEEVQRYSHVKKAGIFTVIEGACNFSMRNIMQRIHRNQEKFQAKFERKQEAEIVYYEEKRRKQKEERMTHSTKADILSTSMSARVQ